MTGAVFGLPLFLFRAEANLKAEPLVAGWCITGRDGGELLRERGRPLDERAAIARAQQGDPDAYGSLVRAYQEAAFRAAYLVVRDEAEAQDVAQEAFLRAHRSLRRFDVSRSFRPWLLRIVTNLAMNSIRSDRRRRAMAERYQQDGLARSVAPSPEASALAAEQARMVWAAMGALNPQEQTVLYLRYFLGASEQETAQAVGRPVGTIKSRVHRALRRLRSVIEDGYPDLILGTHAEGAKETGP